MGLGAFDPLNAGDHRLAKRETAQNSNHRFGDNFINRLKREGVRRG
jgi:hypothetical protein